MAVKPVATYSIEDITAQVLHRIGAGEIFAQGGVVARKQKGSQAEGSCPFCGDGKHFSYSVEKGLWICYKCGEKGNLVTFVSKVNKCSYPKALEMLAKMVGIEPAKPKPRASSKTKTEQPTKQQDERSIRQQTEQPLKQQTEKRSALPLPGAVSAAVYERLTEVCPLTAEHRAALRENRGFTDETIDALRFRSCGAHVKAIVENVLRSEFPEGDLLASGVLVKVNGVLLVNDQLTGDRVLIPYLDAEGRVYHLRPHKLGFKDMPPEVYCRFLLNKSPEHVVLTEGEFKAAALYQWGVPAAAVPGISSFGGRHFERLVETLRTAGVKAVTVVYDNEIKDDPAYSNYKPKVSDRYDTQAWACIMAAKLAGPAANFRARVGWLPDEWRRGAKVDWDGALSRGYTREQVMGVLSRAVTASEFQASLSEEARYVVKKKVGKHFARLNIRREFNRYVTTKSRGENTWDEDLSNFVIDIKSSFFTPEGVVRQVQFVNDLGQPSEVFSLQPDSMAGVNEFKKFCLGRGNYLFKGSATDLTAMWEYEFLNEDGQMIYMPDRIGRLDNDVWLFGNLAIRRGQAYSPDRDGIFWIDGRGYKPQSLQLSPTGAAIEDSIPALYESDVDIKMIARNLKQAVGGADGGYEAFAGIGWVIATVFGDDIFAKYKCLPILFPHGKRESGKSTYMRWMQSFFGIESAGYGLSETTQNFIARALSYYSSLGCWFDEYRNEPKVTQKDGYLRSAYNRQLSGKGTATNFQARGFSVRATIAVSGEEMPKDNGLYTRLVPVQLSARKHDNEIFEWVNRNSSKFSGFVRELIMNYNAYKERIIPAIGELRKTLIARDVPDRIAENWAICAAPFFEIVEQDEAFIRWVEGNCQEIKFTRESEHMLNVFWDDLNTMITMRELDARYLKVSEDGGTLYVWFQGVYNVWSLFFRRKTGREPFDKMSVLKYMQDEEYCGKQAVVRLSQTNHKVYCLDLSKAPDAVVEIAETVSEMQGSAFTGRRDAKEEEMF